MKTETKDIFELLGIPNLPKTSETFKEMNDLDSLAKMHFGYKSVYQSIRKDCVAKIEELNLKIATADRLIEMTSALEILLKKDKPVAKKSCVLSQPQSDVSSANKRLKVNEAIYNIINLFACLAANDDIETIKEITISNVELTSRLGKHKDYVHMLSKRYESNILIEKAELVNNLRYWRLNEKGVKIVRQIINYDALGQKIDVKSIIDSVLSKTILKNHYTTAVTDDKSSFILKIIKKKLNQKLDDTAIRINQDYTTIRISISELIKASIDAGKTTKSTASGYIYNWVQSKRCITTTETRGVYKLTPTGIRAIESLNNE
jgi:hypothetical protein